jgi:hypothetical protein
MAYGVATSTDTPNPDPGEEYTPRAPDEWPDVVAQPVPVTPSNDDTFAGPVQTPEQVLGSGGPCSSTSSRSPRRSARLCPTSRPTRRRQDVRR